MSFFFFFFVLACLCVCVRVYFNGLHFIVLLCICEYSRQKNVHSILSFSRDRIMQWFERAKVSETFLLFLKISQRERRRRRRRL